MNRREGRKKRRQPYMRRMEKGNPKYGATNRGETRGGKGLKEWGKKKVRNLKRAPPGKD